MSADRQLEAIIYRWEDGWSVVCAVDLDDDYDLPVKMKFCDPSGEVGVEFFWAKGLSSCGSDDGVFFDGLVGQKILGFFLDAGVADRPYYLSFDFGVRTTTSGPLRFPAYVPDELWARRYDQAHALLGKGEYGDLLLWEAMVFRRDLSEDRDEDDEDEEDDEDGWSRDEDRWDHDEVRLQIFDEASVESDIEGSSVEEAVDNFADHFLVLPESGREAWEQENVLLGTWALPSPEEVEVYRTLGEELPFQWEASRLAAWLRERSS